MAEQLPTQPKHWSVTSPEFGEVIPILDDGSGPMEYGCDYALVIAPTKRAARSLAVRAWRKNARTHSDSLKEPMAGVEEAYGRLQWCDGGNENPFVGLKVEELAPCPTHGYALEDCSEQGGCFPEWHEEVSRG